MDMTIRIFIGTPSNNEDLESQAVLEYTLREHASEELDITWMKLSRDPASFWYSAPLKNEGWLTRGWATPFSAFRWGIPAACNFEGKAIYLDIDMIVMADIAQLWNTKFMSGSFVIAKNENTFCCSLFDCARARKHLPPIERIKREHACYAHLRRDFRPGQVQFFPTGQNWNCLDGERYADIRDPEIKIVHCTEIPTQPQLKYALPRLQREGGAHWYKHVNAIRPHPRKDITALFDRKLQEAAINGYTIEKYQTAETFGDYHRG
jgi:hypothetical protein